MANTKTSGALLDATQYQAEATAKYEAVYGQHFISPGGADSARACIARLGLKPGMRVLPGAPMMSMVDVAQLVESRIVIPAVAGSNPVVHPTFCMGR